MAYQSVNAVKSNYNWKTTTGGGNICGNNTVVRMQNMFAVPETEEAPAILTCVLQTFKIMLYVL